MQDFLSAREIAEKLAVSDERARQLIASLPHIDVRAPGARKALLRVRKEVFDDWLRAQDKFKLDHRRIYSKGGS